MHNITDAAVFTPDVPVPDDGVDLRTAASLEGAFQALSNRTFWVYALLTGNVLGFDVSFRRNVFVGAVLQVLGAAQLLGNLTVSGISLFTGGCTFQGVTSFNALIDALAIHVGTLQVNVNTTLGQSIANTCDIFASCNLRGNNIAQGSFVTSGAFNCAGGGQFTSPVACSGNGRLYRPAIVGPQSGGGVLSAQAANLYYFPTVTADQSVRVASSDNEGDEIEIVTNSTAHLIDVYQPDNTTLIEAGLIVGVVGHARAIRLKKIAGTYVKIQTVPGT